MSNVVTEDNLLLQLADMRAKIAKSQEQLLLKSDQAALDATIAASAKLLGVASTAASAGGVAVTVWMTDDNSSVANATQSIVPPGGWFYWDPTDEPAIPGMVVKWLLVTELLHNSTPPGVTITLGWRRIASVGGAAGGISYSMVADPDPDQRANAHAGISGGFDREVALLDPPATVGRYAAFAAYSGTRAANSWTASKARLYRAYVEDE